MHRLAVLSNRLPVALTRGPDDRFTAAHSPGGLVNALEPVLRRKGGRWIGWPGVASEECDGDQVRGVLSEVEDGIRLVPVSLSRAEIDRYYGGFSNSGLWPVFHGLVDRCRVDATAWRSYQEVNRRFARRLIGELGEGDTAWVHDYQLLLVGQEVRSERPAACLGFFLHIPFPRPDELLALPGSHEILTALLAHDLIGFQTRRDLGRFAEALSCLLHLKACPAGEGRIRITAPGGHTVLAGHFPIGIDAAAWMRRAASIEVEDRMDDLRRAIGPQALMLGVDRLDYTKGLLERLAAYERMLERHPESHGKVTLVQVVVPSREAVSDYAALKQELEREVGRLCGRFATPGWVPVRHLYRSLDAGELAALYRMADVALVTPLCDGMNLVAKEYCAAQADGFGALVLGEQAGAAEQLGAAGAVLVSPRQADATADAMHRALTMDMGERRRRMEAMRRAVAEEDVFGWADGFLTELDEARARRPARRGARVAPSTGAVAGAPMSRRHAMG
jgi:trehalose 6-phosphate synthase/phosphatase